MDSIGKIKPYMFSFFFFEKKEGRLHYLVLVSSYLPFLGWGDLRCGADILISFFFCFRFVFVFFFLKRLASSSMESTTLSTYMYVPEVDLLLREYGRGCLIVTNCHLD